MLKLYNTRTRRKEEFTPLDPSNVRMYVCGPTVYDYAHIGNARPIIVFDVLFRLLRHLAAKGEWDGGKGQTKVTYARNITDVDDKINARAAEQYPDMPLNEAIRKVTEETAAQFQADVTALGCLEPTVQPRATEHIDDMKRMIETLVEKGCAYAAEGHVLFHVAAMKDYGQLSRRSLDEMQAGARVEIAPYKRDPMDFVLWKPSKEGEPGWPSPCGIDGLGRPGWHIECSAMSERHLGDVFDIHGGGIDLVFPHHENELAQSRCAHGTDVMANVWMHNGFLQVEGEKMSKSLGNFFTIHSLIYTRSFGGQHWDGEVIRLAMLKTNYRQPIDWTVSLLNEAKTNFDQFVEVRHRFDPTQPSVDFLSTLEDDLNTKAAIDILMHQCEEARNGNSKTGGEFVASLNLMGFLDYNFIRGALSFCDDENFDEQQFYEELRQHIPQNALIGSVKRNIIKNDGYPLIIRKTLENILKFSSNSVYISDFLNKKTEIENANSLIEARLAARKAKNWAEADRIRDELAAQGILLKDAKDPETGEIVTTWEIAR